jgi:DNA-binding LacI/PurR family transcriptional regulator
MAVMAGKKRDKKNRKSGGRSASAMNGTGERFRRPSIKDIAILAQVSHPTVSRALRQSPLVNAETAERIRQIAAKAGYHVSAVARGLVTRRTRAVGLVVTSIADPFTSMVASGVEQTARDLGYTVMLADSNADPDREQRIVHAFAEQRLDGIIVTSSRVGALYLPLLEEMRVPIVLINDQHPGQFAHSVMINNRAGGRLAVSHLASLGHRRIAYIGDRHGYQSDVERRAGYRDALRAAGIEFAMDLVVSGDGKPEAAEQAMNELLRLRDRPTAVFCYNDMSAMGAIRSIRRHGLHIPAEISVCGFDDLFLADYLDPPLTTIRQPMRRMGEMAVEHLVEVIAGGEERVRVRVDPELVVRRSTAPAP